MATGAQGVALTPGRSIAVDPPSIPYGTPEPRLDLVRRQHHHTG